MEQGAALRVAIQRISRLIRQRRAVYYGLRGLAWGLGTAVIPLALRGLLGATTWWLTGGLAAAGLLAGLVYGLALRIPAADAARVADRAFSLHDRLATALELVESGQTDSLATAAVRDASARASGLDARHAVRWRWPREVRLIPIPVVAMAVLAYLPAIPVPEDLFVPHVKSADEPEKERDRAGAPQVAERQVAKRTESAQRVELQEREYAQRQNPNTEPIKGDLAAMFKDTSVANKRPDFSSFLKQGDDRLRVLERTDSLPDLQRDFTQTPYSMTFRKSKSLLAGMDPRQLSPEKLKQLLEEMSRMGRRGGNPGGEGDWGAEMMEGSQALEQGQMSRALAAMERALGKMRAMEERERGGRGLDGGKDRGGRGRDGRGGRGGDPDLDFGEGEGSMPGKGTNPGWRGDPTARLGQNPLDFGVEGQMRRGRKEAYDTNMVGRGAQNPSRLPYMSVYSQYRKMMEDALAKESIPFDYKSQVKEYFQSLEER